MLQRRSLLIQEAKAKQEHLQEYRNLTEGFQRVESTA